MRRFVVSIQNKERNDDQMLRLSTVSGGMFNWADRLLREELDPLMRIFRLTDPEVYSDYRSARVITDIGVRP